MDQKTFTTFQVAKIAAVFPTTVINWINKGKLPAHRTPGGHRRVQLADLLAFLRKYNMPIPAGLDTGVWERKKVLVVDDDPVVGTMLRKAFGKYPEFFDAREVRDGVEALVLIGKWMPDLVILDAVMPVVDGMRVCASLKADPQTSGIKIIAVTGKKLSDSQRQYLQSNTDGYFSKPLDLLQLLGTAARLLKLPEDRIHHDTPRVRKDHRHKAASQVSSS